MSKRDTSTKIVGLQQLLGLRQQLRAAGKRLVLTNGHFDLLHVGHLRNLQQAKSLGDVLVVAINSDRTTRLLKGPQRPVVPEGERAELLAALACVDYVIVFDDLTAEGLVVTLTPDVYVKGADYAPTADPGPGSSKEGGGKPLPEARIVASYGGQVVLLPLVESHSTSALIQRIVDLHKRGPQAS